MSPELIFIHIPKTGGISFLHTLQQVYGTENVKQIWELLPCAEDAVHNGDYTHREDSIFYQHHALFREVLNDALRSANYPVLFGHMPVWVLEDVFPGVPRVTWLREPTEQVLSRVFHFRKARIGGYQGWSSPAAIAMEPIFRNCQSFYTGGYLRAFKFVGILERYAADLAALGKMLGWPDVEPRHYHPTDFENDKRDALRRDSYFMEMLRRVNARDVMLYDWAVKRG